MKKIILSSLLAVIMTSIAYSERTAVPLQIHQSGSQSDNLEEDRYSIQLPIFVFFDPLTNKVEVWSQDEMIQAKIFIFDENDNVEAYSPHMNVEIQLDSSSPHSIRIKGNGWEAEAEF